MTDLVEQLASMKGQVEDLLVRSHEWSVEAAARAIDAYDREHALEELKALSKGLDAMYDRRTSGLVYSLWYSPRRIHDAVRALLPLVDQRRGNVVIFDLGAGTGAAWWACAFIERARRELGQQPLTYRITAIEASYPMLLEGRRVWRKLTELDPALTAPVEVDFVPATIAFSRPAEKVEHGAIAYAGYLVDSSDKVRAVALGRTLANLCHRWGVSDIALVGAKNKTEVTAEVRKGLEVEPWAASNVQSAPKIWTGVAQGLGRLREQFAAGTGARMPFFGRPPTWTYDGEPIVHYVRLVGLAGEGRLVDPEAQSQLVLDEKQKAAAAPSDRACTAIVGAAGSGKSRVLIERVIRTLEAAAGRQRGGRRQEHVLVTAFNAALVNQLADWFLEETPTRPMLSGVRVTRRDDGDVEASVGSGSTVRFINIDKIPPRLYKVTTTGVNTKPEMWAQLHARWALERPDEAKRLPSVTPDFLAAEYTRVVYGLGVSTLDDYRKVQRLGRLDSLRSSSRDVVWRIFERKKKDKVRLFVDIRAEAVKKAASGRHGGIAQMPLFTRLFVDEAQDLLPPDMRMLQALCKDGAPVVLAADETQAMHIGASYLRNKLVPRKQWEQHVLAGSYRLPIRVCEAIKPVAQLVEQQRKSGAYAQSEDPYGDDVVLPEAVRGASLGVRPIILAGDESEVARSIEEIAKAYRPLMANSGATRITVAEDDGRLKKIVERAKEALQYADADGRAITVMIETSTMRKIKGLERPFVVWSTARTLSSDDTSAEWIYTILSRTTGLLVIWIDRDTPSEIARVVSRLDSTRLMFWTREAELAFSRMQNSQSMGKA